MPTVATGAIGGGLLALAFCGAAAPAAEEGQGAAASVADPVPYVGTIYTWVGTTEDVHTIGNYRETTRDGNGDFVLAETAPSEKWQDVWASSDNPNVIRFDGTDAVHGLDYSFTPLCLSGIIVEKGATGYSIKTRTVSGQRHITMGNSGPETAYSTINEDFSISNADGNADSLFTLRGTQKWTIAEGATLTLAGKGQKGVKNTGDLTIQGGGATDVTSRLSLEENSTLSVTGNSTLTVSGGMVLEKDSKLNIGEGASVVVVGSFADNGGTVSNSTAGSFVLQDVTAAGLTVGAGSYYTLSGTSSLTGSLTVEEGGTLDVSRLYKFDWCRLDGSDIGFTVNGTVVGGATPHIFAGNDANLNRYAYYDEAQKKFVAQQWQDEELLHWVGGTDNNSWSAAANWQIGNETLAATPEIGMDLRLLGTGTIVIDGDISQNRLIFGQNSNYTFVVEPEHSTVLNAGCVLREGARLSKDGAGSLTMTKDRARQLRVSVLAGSLVLSDTLQNTTQVDLTPLTVAAGGNVSVALTGGLGGSGNYGILDLGENFYGSLTIRKGLLHLTHNDTHLGNVSKFVLDDMGGLMVNQATTLSQDIHIGKSGYLNVYKQSFTHTGRLTGDKDTVLYTYGFGDGDAKTTFHDLTGFHGMLNLTTYNATLAGNQGDVSIQGLLLGKFNQDNVTLHIEAGTNVHIVGENNSVTENVGSLLLAYGTGGAGAINIAGSLVSEAGISTSLDRVGTVNVQAGGVLQFNKGVRGDSRGIVSINVQEGGTLKVSGTNNSEVVDDKFTINMQNGSTLQGGAGGTDATVNQHIAIQDGSTVNVGAVNGKTLTLSASALSTVTGGTLNIVGDAAGGKVVLDSLQHAQVSLNAGANVELIGATSLTKIEVVDGATAVLSGNTALTGEGLVVQNGGTAAITGGSVFLASVENSGTLDLSGLTQLTIGALQKDGGSVKIGKIVSSSLLLPDGTVDIESLINLIRPTDGLRITYSDGYLYSSSMPLYWKGADATGGRWDAESLAWSNDQHASAGDQVFDASHIAEFGEGGAPSVTVAESGVSTPAVHVTAEGYSFSGGVVSTSEIWAANSVSFDNKVAALKGSLRLRVSSGATATVKTLVGNGSDTIQVLGGGALELYGAEGSFGALSVEGQATLQLLAREGADEVALAVGNATLGSANGYAKNLVVRDGAVAPMDAGAVAELHNIRLVAGTEAQHATVSGVQFTGEGNTWGGYLDMGDAAAVTVADGSSLSISESGLVVDLGKVAQLEKEHTIASLADGSSRLLNWDAGHIRFFYNGIEMASSVLAMGSAGKVTVTLGEGAPFYWDGTPGSVWNATETNWAGAEGTEGSLAFKAFGNVQFGKVPTGGVKTVVQEATLPVGNISVTEGGYAFSGAPIKAYGSLDVSAVGVTRFDSNVEVSKGVRLGNHEELALEGITTAVSFAGNLKAQSLALQCGTADAPRAVQGTYTFQSIEVGTAIFNVDDMRLGGMNDATPRVVVNGALTANEIYIQGNAGKAFNGVITSSNVYISAGGDDHNVVVFGEAGNKITRLELSDSAKLSIAKDNQNIANIVVGDALLRFELKSGYYNNSGAGYNIYSSHDNATLELMGITYTTIAKLSGREAAAGELHSFTIDSKGRSLDINNVENLKDLTIRSGVAKINGVAAGGGVHRDLVIKDEASVRLASNNVMAQGSREMRVEDAILQLLGTEQKLYAAAGGTGNAMYLDYADILGSSTGTGIHVVQSAPGTAGTLNATFKHISNITANMALDGGTETRFIGDAGASLTLAGIVSGSGNMAVAGAGSSVTLQGQNSLTGTVTVEDGAELVIANKQALGNAHLVMGANSALSLETRGEYPVTLKTLVLGDNVTINIDRLEGTDSANAAKAAFNVDSWSVGKGNSLTLNFTFGEGVGMEAVKTYNLFASTAEIDKTPLGALNIWYVNESGQLVQLDSKDYIYNYTKVGDQWVFFIRTRFGNVWQGDDGTGSGIWSRESGAGGNWQDGKYQEEGVAYKDAIFSDLKGSDGQTLLTSATVTLVDEVAPGNVHFDARDTGYLLQESGSGKLAADTVIHKSGLGNVTLDLANNATMENSIAGMQIHRGTMSLKDHNLAFSGSIVIDPVIQLDIALDTKEQYVVSGLYKAKGKFWGVTLGQGSIAGAPESLQAGKSYIENADIIANQAGGAKLSYVELKGTGSLENATIGSGVSIGEKGNYTLSGLMWFDDALKLGNGAHVTIAANSQIDVGGLRPDIDYSKDQTVYIYTLLTNADGGNAADGSLTITTAKDMMLINGVNLSSLKGTNVTISQYKENGKDIPGKIQLTLDGADITPWDGRWGNGVGPAVGMTNTKDTVLYDGTSDKYLYSKLVDAEGADNIVVASISRGWGNADGKKNPLIGSTGTDKEIWIYNHGAGNFETLVTGSATVGSTQSGATHLMVMGGQAGADAVTVGGSRDATQTGQSYVTIDGVGTARGIVVGGSYGLNQSVTQSGASHVYMDNGTILTMLIAGSYEGDMAADTHLAISGGTLQTVYGGSYAKKNSDRGNTAGNIEAKLTGGSIDTFYGGGTGNTGGKGKTISVTVDGAKIDNLYASNNGGKVTGDIVLNLVSGTAETVRLASLGTEVYGSYVVRLGKGFTLGNVTGSDTSIKGIYGGHGTNSGIAVKSDFTSRLELVDAGATYDFFPGAHNNVNQIREILGFDEIALADQVTLRVDNRHFCNITDVILSTLNKGDMATVIFGKANETGSGSSSDKSRTGSITLEEGITFKFETSYGYNELQDISKMPIIHVKSGSMVDLTGFPREQGVDDGGGCISFQMHLAGDGIDGRGAIYKGAGEYSTSPDGKVAMPHIVLEDNASVNAAASNIIVCGNGYSDTYLELQGHTMTKIGPQVLRFYASQEAAPNGTPGVGGTFFIKEGVVDYLMKSNSREVDYVLGKEGTLSLTQHGDGTSLVLRSLSGEGTVNLTKNTELKLESDYKTAYGVFYKDWLSQGKYNNSNSGGYAYGVFSGKIISDDASSELIKSGAGTQVLSGSDSTYQGLTKIQQGILYLVGTSTGELTSPGQSAHVEKGVVGQSSLVWESVNGSTPVLKLGEGVRIFNNGYALDGSEMTIEVAAAQQGSPALDFVVKDAQGNYVAVEMDGKVYYQMDTARIKSVNATGFYADAAEGQSKAYVSGAEIDRNRTLYLSADELGMTVADSLQQASRTIHYTIKGCEQINVSKLLTAGLSSLDCNGYYGDGTAYNAGTAIDEAFAKEHNGLFVTTNGMSPTAGRYLQYSSEPLIAYVPDDEIMAGDGGVAESGAAANNGTPYVQYDLGGLKDPGLVPEALREDSLFYVTISYKDDKDYGTANVQRYITYVGLQSVAAGAIEGATLVSIDRVLLKEKEPLADTVKEAVANLNQVMSEAQIAKKDIDISLEGVEVKDGVSSVAANGYYVDKDGKVLALYVAGETIDPAKGTLLIPSSRGNQAIVVVTGLNDSGYEEATYSGVLSDNGNKSPSHLTKVGKGTLTIDQRNLYSGDTNLKEGTLNLKGWAQLQRQVEKSAYRFNQSEDTSLKLSYDGSYQDEPTELSTDLVITGKGDARWTKEETTENRTAALISDVGEKVSFTLSGNISGDGNVLHSGKGQLHISGSNSYEGGTTVTEGVVYVESETALGDTASDNMSAKVVVAKHTEDGKGGTLVITNLPDSAEGGSGYVRFNSNRNAIEGTVYIGGYKPGADTNVLTGAGADDSAGAILLMTGNGYWAEKTILSSKSALIFNGTASTNKEMEGSSIIHEAGLLVGSGDLAVSGPAGKGTIVRFADIGNKAVARAGTESEGFQGNICIEGNNARLEIGAGNYRAGEGKSISISGYNATMEAVNSDIAVGKGGAIRLSSLGHQENENENGAAVLQAHSVKVEAGGTLGTYNAGTDFRYNLAAIEKANQISTHESLIGHRGPNPAPEYDKEPGKWNEGLQGKDGKPTLQLATKLKNPYTKSYDSELAVNTNRAAIVDSDVSMASGSTYEVSFANTSLGRHALTLESKGGAYSAENRVNLDLSLNGDTLQWDEAGRSISQIVLFTGVSSVTFSYEGNIVNTDSLEGEIFYMAAQDFFYDAHNGRYIDDKTLLVYDRGAQIIYLDRALPEPATATLSLLALAALAARRRRK